MRILYNTSLLTELQAFMKSMKSMMMIIFKTSINQLVCVMQAHCVSCMVGNTFLNISSMNVEFHSCNLLWKKW
jgi:hypothetical protein